MPESFSTESHRVQDELPFETSEIKLHVSLPIQRLQSIVRSSDVLASLKKQFKTQDVIVRKDGTILINKKVVLRITVVDGALTVEYTFQEKEEREYSLNFDYTPLNKRLFDDNARAIISCIVFAATNNYVNENRSEKIGSPSWIPDEYIESKTVPLGFLTALLSHADTDGHLIAILDNGEVMCDGVVVLKLSLSKTGFSLRRDLITSTIHVPYKTEKDVEVFFIKFFHRLVSQVFHQWQE